eukprot:PhF_6_TR42772/c1_g1_i1/m.64695
MTMTDDICAVRAGGLVWSHESCVAIGCGARVVLLHAASLAVICVLLHHTDVVLKIDVAEHPTARRLMTMSNLSITVYDTLTCCCLYNFKNWGSHNNGFLGVAFDNDLPDLIYCARSHSIGFTVDGKTFFQEISADQGHKIEQFCVLRGGMIIMGLSGATVQLRRPNGNTLSSLQLSSLSPVSNRNRHNFVAIDAITTGRESCLVLCATESKSEHHVYVLSFNWSSSSSPSNTLVLHHVELNTISSIRCSFSDASQLGLGTATCEVLYWQLISHVRRQINVMAVACNILPLESDDDGDQKFFVPWDFVLEDVAGYLLSELSIATGTKGGKFKLWSLVD